MRISFIIVIYHIDMLISYFQRLPHDVRLNPFKSCWGSGLSYTLEFGILRYWTFVHWNSSDFCTGIWYIEALDFRIRLICVLEFRILNN